MEGSRCGDGGDGGVMEVVGAAMRVGGKKGRCGNGARGEQPGRGLVGLERWHDKAKRSETKRKQSEAEWRGVVRCGAERSGLGCRTGGTGEGESGDGQES